MGTSYQSHQTVAAARHSLWRSGGTQTAGYVPINQFAGQRAPAPAVLRIEWLTSMMPTSRSMPLQCSQLGLSGKPASRWPGHDESTEPETSRPADGWCPAVGGRTASGAPFSGREAALREDGRTPTPVRRLPRLVSHAALAQEAVCKSNGTPHMHSCRKPQTTCRRARVRNQSPRPSIVQHAASNADPHRDLPPGARLGLGRANFRPGRWVAKGPQARR